MPRRRTYGQYCPLATALDVVGERWTLLVIRELLVGPQRYSDLLQGLPGISTSLLSDRLRHLEADGIIERSFLPPPAASTVYELTEDGRELAAALVPLAIWGGRRLGRRRKNQSFRLRWLLVFFRTTLNTELSKGVHDIYEFRIDGQTFHAKVDDGTVAVVEGPAPAGTPADMTITCDLETFVGIGLGGLDPVEAVSAGRVKVEGTREAIQRSLNILRPGAAGILLNGSKALLPSR